MRARTHDDTVSTIPERTDGHHRAGAGRAAHGLPARPSARLPPPASDAARSAHAVQARALDAATRRDEVDVFGWGQHGVSGPPQRLPHHDAIATSFGRHDVSAIGAHIGGAAAEAAGAIGARAFAIGDQIAFGAEPDLHTAAHEAAHVVQQARGVDLPGGVGERGDAYERHANEVADRVVDGVSTEELLGEPTTGAAVAPAVQREDRDATDADPERTMTTANQATRRMENLREQIGTDYDSLCLLVDDLDAALGDWMCFYYAVGEAYTTAKSNFDTALANQRLADERTQTLLFALLDVVAAGLSGFTTTFLGINAAIESGTATVRQCLKDARWAAVRTFAGSNPDLGEALADGLTAGAERMSGVGDALLSPVVEAGAAAADAVTGSDTDAHSVGATTPLVFQNRYMAAITRIQGGALREVTATKRVALGAQRALLRDEGAAIDAADETAYLAVVDSAAAAATALSAAVQSLDTRTRACALFTPPPAVDGLAAELERGLWAQWLPVSERLLTEVEVPCMVATDRSLMYVEHATGPVIGIDIPPNGALARHGGMSPSGSLCHVDVPSGAVETSLRDGGDMVEAALARLLIPLPSEDEGATLAWATSYRPAVLLP